MPSPFFEGKLTEKRTILVKVNLTNEQIEGAVYLNQNQRLQDLLNSGREYLPVFRTDVETHRIELINKDYIVSIFEA